MLSRKKMNLHILQIRKWHLTTHGNNNLYLKYKIHALIITKMSHALKPIGVELIALSTQLKTSSHNVYNTSYL